MGKGLISTCAPTKGVMTIGARAMSRNCTRLKRSVDIVGNLQFYSEEHWKWIIFGVLPCALTGSIRIMVENHPNILDGVLAQDAHEHWRLLALLMLFASVVCYWPPRMLAARFAWLQLPEEWRAHMARNYQTFITALCLLSISFHISAGSDSIRLKLAKALVPSSLLPLFAWDFRTQTRIPHSCVDALCSFWL